MKYIEDFKEGETIIGHYLCKQKQTLKSRAGKTYLSIRLQDKTGTIEGKVWELNNNIQNFEENDFIKVEAIVLTYQNDLQLNIKKIRCSQEGEYDTINYIPCTDKDINSLYNQFMNYINSMSNQYIKKLLENIFIKNKFISEEIKKHSAAKSMHHSYMGGLLEHTLSVVQICDFMSSQYKYVNRDILVASAMLHDVGKLFEISSFPDNDYTDEGQLIGHIVIGTEMITKEAALIEGFPEQLKNLLKHCILSHHGEYEYGSPKRPKTIEAFILHCADDMDAKSKMFEEMIIKDNTQGKWVGYNRMLSRNIRKSEYE